jgi:8-hydroxy-5-deazaflavin:NADPH oxidoreductase
MKIAILGTGMVGETIAGRLVGLGHEVKMGSRTATNEKAVAWAKKAGAKASHGTFADAAEFGEMIFNCTSGGGAIEALKQAGEKNLGEKILIDISNPLDFSKGMPPSLFVSNTDSLGEQIQRTFPRVKVVKALNTLNCYLMVNPAMLPGDHNAFLAGNDPDAKTKVIEFFSTNFGWKPKNLLDLGGITAARATESLLPIWLCLWSKLQNPNFNFQVVVGPAPKT